MANTETPTHGAPAEHGPGDDVFAGTINGDETLNVEATKAAAA